MGRQSSSSGCRSASRGFPSSGAVPAPPRSPELFDRAKDPLDQTNVAAPHPDTVKQLTEELTAWRKWAEENALPEADSTEGLSDDELRRLRSWGYIQ